MPRPEVASCGWVFMVGPKEEGWRLCKVDGLGLDDSPLTVVTNEDILKDAVMPVVD